MALIMTCHIFQREGISTDIKGLHIEWAYWLNTGVPMFLFVSGYLYGMRDKIDTVHFLMHRYSRLLVNYYVFIFGMAALIIVSPRIGIRLYDFKNLLFLSDTVPGLEHLWFVPTILFCSSLVPVLLEIFNKIDNRSNLRFSVESLLLLLLIHGIFLNLEKTPFSSAWINSFAIGMVYARIERRKRIKTILTVLITLLCLCVIGILICANCCPHEGLPYIIFDRYGLIVQYGHVFLGIVLVVMMRFFIIQSDQSLKNI